MIWKSLVLPASGTALCWLLLMTLWLPALDYARSYGPLVHNVKQAIDAPGCVEELGLTRAQVTAFVYHGQMDLQPEGGDASCPWLLVAAPVQRDASIEVDLRRWREVAKVRRPSDRDENIIVYRRVHRR